MATKRIRTTWLSLFLPITSRFSRSCAIFQYHLKEYFSIRDDGTNGVIVDYLKEIGRSKAYDEHRNVDNLLGNMQEKHRPALFNK